MNGGMIPVLSATIAGIWHDSRTNCLLVTFDRKKTYCYRDFPKSKFDEFLSAPTKGGFLNAEIKPYYSFSELNALEVDTMIANGSPQNFNRTKIRQPPPEMVSTYPVLSALF